jgi:uncharacterized membrane protein YgaE (UPF0421/DUF939 family)
MMLGISTNGLQLAIRAGLAAGLSIAIAQFFKLEYPIYAFIAAVIATDLKPAESRRLGFVRIVATVVGALLGAALSAAFPPGPMTVGVSIVIAMLFCNLIRAPESARVAGFICGLVVFDHASAPFHYAFFRFIETVLGVAVAWAISYVPKLIRAEQPAS